MAAGPRPSARGGGRRGRRGAGPTAPPPEMPHGTPLPPPSGGSAPSCGSPPAAAPQGSDGSVAGSLGRGDVAEVGNRSDGDAPLEGLGLLGVPRQPGPGGRPAPRTGPGAGMPVRVGIDVPIGRIRRDDLFARPPASARGAPSCGLGGRRRLADTKHADAAHDPVRWGVARAAPAAPSRTQAARASAARDRGRGPGAVWDAPRARRPARTRPGRRDGFRAPGPRARAGPSAAAARPPRADDIGGGAHRQTLAPGAAGIERAPAGRTHASARCGALLPPEPPGVQIPVPPCSTLHSRGIASSGVASIHRAHPSAASPPCPRRTSALNRAARDRPGSRGSAPRRTATWAPSVPSRSEGRNHPLRSPIRVTGTVGASETGGPGRPWPNSASGRGDAGLEGRLDPRRPRRPGAGNGGHEPSTGPRPAAHLRTAPDPCTSDAQMREAADGTASAWGPTRRQPGDPNGLRPEEDPGAIR